MFEVKRREQLLALKNLAQLNDIHQQYKILDVMLKGLFKVCQGTGQLPADGVLCGVVFNEEVTVYVEEWERRSVNWGWS